VERSVHTVATIPVDDLVQKASWLVVYFLHEVTDGVVGELLLARDGAVVDAVALAAWAYEQYILNDVQPKLMLLLQLLSVLKSLSFNLLVLGGLHFEELGFNKFVVDVIVEIVFVTDEVDSAVLAV